MANPLDVTLQTGRSVHLGLPHVIQPNAEGIEYLLQTPEGRFQFLTSASMSESLVLPHLWSSDGFIEDRNPSTTLFALAYMTPGALEDVGHSYSVTRIGRNLAMCYWKLNRSL